MTPKSAATLRDVALMAGVSKSAVSAAFTGNGRLGEETRNAILRAAHELGFEPNIHAQRLQSKSVSDLVGLFTLDFDLSVGTRKIKILRHLLSRQGFQVQIHSCGYQKAAAPREVRLLCQQRPRAIICNTTDLSGAALDELQGFQEKGGVVVCYDRPVALECDRVEFDRADNTYQAANHLLRLGHRGIGYFQVGKNGRPNERLQGFGAALKGFGLEARPQWIFESDGMDEFEDDGEQMAQYFLSLEDRPTALCIVNDFAAIAFISLVQSAGVRVPQDLSVVGHDNRAMARFCNVPLSSVSQPVELIAEKVIELLGCRLNDSTSPFRREIVRGELIVRASSGAPA